MDDFLPFDEENNLLLPATSYEFELWPMLLSKAIIKLANVEYVMGNYYLCENNKVGATTSMLRAFNKINPMESFLLHNVNIQI